MAGHKWDRGGERCELCGDKDWYADRFCSGNPDVAEEREAWLAERTLDDTAVACAASDNADAHASATEGRR